MTEPGRLFNRQELLRAIWGDSAYRDPRAIDVHIRHLREKLEARPEEPRADPHGARRRLPLRGAVMAEHRRMERRPRLVGPAPAAARRALLTAVVTLAVAALALLAPLEQRLREDGESTVKTALGASRLEFSEIQFDHATGRLDSQELSRDASALHRRADAAVTVLDSRLRLVSPTPSGESPDGARLLRAGTRRPEHGPARAHARRRPAAWWRSRSRSAAAATSWCSTSAWTTSPPQGGWCASPFSRPPRRGC